MKSIRIFLLDFAYFYLILFIIYFDLFTAIAINEQNCGRFVIKQVTLKAVQAQAVVFAVVQLFPLFLLQLILRWTSFK